MNLIQYHTKQFSNRLFEFCTQEDVFAEDCELMVTEWLSSIQKTHRPTVTSIVMNAKRIKWGSELVL